MGLIDSFYGKKIFVDSAPVIYFIEGNSKYQTFLNELFSAADNNKLTLITSTLTLLEVLVQPLRLGKKKLADKFLNILTNSDNFQLIDLDTTISVTAAQIRSVSNLKTPDSIQLATSIHQSAEIFLTNDKRIKSDEIKITVLENIKQ